MMEKGWYKLRNMANKDIKIKIKIKIKITGRGREGERLGKGGVGWSRV